MGYKYENSPVIVPDGAATPLDDPSVYIQTARPGHRAPHHWLRDGRSTIDLFGRGFVLLRFGADAPGIDTLAQVALKVGMPMECVTLDEPEVARLYERKLVLVRPDGMVAWRADSLPKDVEGFVDQVRGAVPRSGSISTIKNSAGETAKFSLAG